MNKLIGMAAIVAASAFASSASAVTYTTAGITGAFNCGGAGGLPAGTIDVLAGATFNADFVHNDAGGSFCFDFVNTSATKAAVTIASATVNQNGNFWGFLGGVTLKDLSGNNFVNTSWAQGVADVRNFSFTLAAGQSMFFDFTYGQAYGSGFANPDIDFAVFASAVPVPAAGILLLSALGAGIAANRRRKSA